MEKLPSLNIKTDILVIDNYDSFTYNLVQYLGVIGKNIKVRRNEGITISEIEQLEPEKIVISPGPGKPENAGISKELISYFYKKIPILGVCLGHQCIAEVFGARIINSQLIFHGKTSLIYHDENTIFKGISNPFEAARYHSLIVKEDTLPDFLEVSARTSDGVVMGIRHRIFPLEGIQFHPESFLTAEGFKLLENFVSL